MSSAEQLSLDPEDPVVMGSNMRHILHHDRSKTMPRSLRLLGGTIAFSLAFLGSLGLLAPCATAQTPLEQSVRVARLIEQLGASDFRQRSNAESELSNLGSAPREQLLTALKSMDAEVRLRAGDLLARLDVAALWGPALVNLNCDKTPVPDVLELLAAQSGNHVMAGERYGSFEEADLTLNLQQASFWEALEVLCRESGNHVRPHYNPRQPGLVVVSGKMGLQPLAYSGPLRGQITTARRVFHEDLDYETGKSEVAHTFHLNLNVIWEDRFRLVAYRGQPQVISALTNTGQQLEVIRPDTPTWNVAAPGMRQLSASLRLAPPPKLATRLTELALRWELIAVGGMTSLDMEPLVAESRLRREDAEFALERIEERPGGRYVVTVLISRDLVTPEPHDALLYENELELLDAGGNPFLHHGETNSLSDRGVRMVVTFQAPEPDTKPQRLRLHYPRIRSQRQAELVFRNVPLPTANPE